VSIRLILVSAVALAIQGVAGDLPHAGLLLDEFDLTLSAGHRVEAFGPLFYQEQKETERTWAVPPLLSYARDPAVDLVEFDFAYPLMSYDRYGSQFRWHFFQLLSFAGGPTQGEANRNRLTLFPFYFQQRSSDPKENYTAIMPFYGHLTKRLFRDEVSFLMFPLYSQTVKGQVVTDNYLVPFFHLRHGPGLRGWQLWPLAGHEHKEVTSRTNLFGDSETVPGHDKTFALWPIYFNEKTGLGSENPDRQQGILPFYSLERSPNRDSTTVLWPFFSRVDDREKKYREWDVPWPLIEFARGEGKQTTRVWPVFSQSRSPTLESDFYLWPIYKFDRLHSDPLDRKRTRIAFYLFSDIRDQNTETGAVRRRTDLWPLFTRRREFNGNRRLQVLALLEPFTAGSHKIERDYSPAWSIWRSERNALTGASSQSLLWNLYRREKAPETRRISACFGLFQYRLHENHKQVRLFYFPFGKEK
jgi:hypothetical protein